MISNLDYGVSTDDIKVSVCVHEWGCGLNCNESKRFRLADHLSLSLSLNACNWQAMSFTALIINFHV